MSGYPYCTGYILYPPDTSRSSQNFDTGSILSGMDDWRSRAKRRMAQLHPPVTQGDLIDVFGVKTRGAVGHYLTGRSDPPVSSIAPLADKLQISLDELLRGTAVQSQSHPVSFTGEMMASAVRLARGAVEAKGMDDFDPASEIGDAELLGLALEEVIELGIQDATDSDVLRFARKVNKGGAGRDGKAGSNRPDGGTDSRTSAAEVGGEGATSGGRRRKSA